MGLTEFLATYITQLIEWLGYGSVLVLMIMESMVFPVPSEAVMPFAGFLIAEGKFSFVGVIFFSTLGSIIGSSLSYYLGKYGGEKFINKYGKYFLLNQADLDKTNRFFDRFGEMAILISRFIPIIRHLISLPAGIAKMNLKKFFIYTIIGAGAWNSFLALVGYLLKNNWEDVMKYSKGLDVAVLGLLIIFVVYFVYKHLVHKKLNGKK